MACRTPVIATPAGAAPQLLAEGGGILVRPRVPKDTARAIERIITLDEPDWLRLSDLAFATANRQIGMMPPTGFEAALRAAIRRAGAISRRDAPIEPAPHPEAGGRGPRSRIPR